MQAQQGKGNANSFFKGISLFDYMKEMSCPEQQTLGEESYGDQNDLYMQCKPKNKKDVANYAIREIDEDNYDQSLDQPLMIQPLYTHDLQKSRIIKFQDNINKGVLLHRKNDPTNRNHSNSPAKDLNSPKKEMFRSLYGHSFANPQAKQSKLLSTLGMNNWRGKHKSLNKKQVQVRDKNRRQYQQIIKYQNVINQKFDTKLTSIRIDGVKDKIHERGIEKAHYKNRF